MGVQQPVDAEHPEWGCGRSLLDSNEVWVACGHGGELCDDCLIRCKTKDDG